MPKRKFPLYLVSVLLFMLILPVGFLLINREEYWSWHLFGKWFVFWPVGVRLFIAGIRQVSKPAFTVKEIFKLDTNESFVIIRELGFANIAIGTLGIVSIFNSAWCAPAAIVGGLYFGFAGALHVFKKPDSTNEIIALISDLWIFAVLLVYLYFVL